jgi:hypothetical protein
MPNVGGLAPSDLPQTVYPYPDPILNPTNVNGQFGTTQAITLKRSQGVLRYSLLCDSLTATGGTTPTVTVSNLLPIVTNVTVQADDDTLFNVDMVPWLEYQRLIQSQTVAQTGYAFDIDMAATDMRRRGELLPATLLRSFQYAQVTMNVTFNAIANITTGSPTTYSTKVHLTELDINRDLIEKLPVMVCKRLQGTQTAGVTNGVNDFVTAFPQTGLLRAAMLVAQTSVSTTYANLSNTEFTNLKLVINDSFTETATTWLALQNQNRSFFGTAPNTGFAVKVWAPTVETGQLMNVSDTQKVTAIDLQVTEALGNTGALTIVREFIK